MPRRVSTSFSNARQMLTASGFGAQPRHQRCSKNHGHHHPGAGHRWCPAEFAVPVWVILMCAGMIALGTALGGWKLIRTLGGKFFKIRPWMASLPSWPQR